MHDFLDFLWAVVNNWAGYLTGGLLIASVWLYFSVREKSMPKTAVFILAGVCLLLAFFKAWEDQHNTSKTLEAQVAELSEPQLSGMIRRVFIAPAGEHGENSVMTVDMFITNKGTPSVAQNMEIFVKRRGRNFRVVALPPPMGKLVLSMGASVDERSITYLADDFLPKKAIDSPIPRGGAVAGFFSFVVEGVSQKEISDAILDIQFEDINGKKYIAERNGLAGNYVIPDMTELERQERRKP